MKTFTVDFDKLHTIWGRQTVSVDAKTPEQAVEIAAKRIEDDGPDNFEYLVDSEENIKPHSLVKYGAITEEIFVDTVKVSDNSAPAERPTPEEIDAAREVLTRAGYEVQYLWHIDDVKNKFNCTDEEAAEVLNIAVNHDIVMQEINERIELEGNEFGLKEIDGF